MKMKFSLDRIENGIAVCLCESDRGLSQYEFSLAAVPVLRSLGEGALFEAELREDGSLCELHVLDQEAEERRAKNSARLRALFDKSKK